MKLIFTGWERIVWDNYNPELGWYNPSVLPDLQLDDHVTLRKPHPCGGFEWRVVRLGADIGLECCQCKRVVLITRRELARRAKKIVSGGQSGTQPG